MIRIDETTLKELGLSSLPEEERKLLLQQILQTLELRVGMTIAQQMSEEQLDEFEEYIDNNDQEGALKWLETNFPSYKQVVADELEKLKQEIMQDADKIKDSVDEA